MRSDELRRAIEGPARAAGLRLEAGLVDAMLADVEGEPGALPLLSHALYESWARRDGRVLTLAGYRAGRRRAGRDRAHGRGGLPGLRSSRSRCSCGGCSSGSPSWARRRRTREGGSRWRSWSRRAKAAARRAVIERLAGARLLVVGDDSAEIAHEALIREWPRLRGWLAEDREELRTLRHLTTAARSWDETGRNDADLYRGPRLAAAVELAGDERQLSRVEREFLDASRDAQTAS